MTKDALIEVLSEAAVEIYNSDGPDNIVFQRVRRTIAELRDSQYWDKRVAASSQCDSAGNILPTEVTTQ